jgi:hypothetical protein
MTQCQAQWHIACAGQLMLGDNGQRGEDVPIPSLLCGIHGDMLDNAFHQIRTLLVPHARVF